MINSKGTVIQVMGPVLDIRFSDNSLPELLTAIRIPNGNAEIIAEVAQHIGDNVVRCIAMSSTDGLQRGAEATDTGAAISVPVGDDWTVTKPFEPKIVDGKLYGRGSADDKGPAMAGLWAAKAVKDLGIPLSKNCRVILGTDEESGSSDIKHYYAIEEEAPATFSPDADFPVSFGEKGICPGMTQTGVELTATTTTYYFEAEGVTLKVAFCSPLLLDDPDLVYGKGYDINFNFRGNIAVLFTQCKRLLYFWDCKGRNNILTSKLF